MHYENLNPWQKVEALEKCVLRDTTTEVDKAFKEMGELGFTARALGFACRYRGLDMVKTLVEGGATFSYDLAWVKLMYSRADCNISIALESENYSFALASSINTAYMRTVFNIGKTHDLELLPLHSRLTILEYLYKNAEKIGFKADEFLFYAHFSEEWDMISALKNKGVTVPQRRIEMITESNGGNDWFDYCYLVSQIDDKQFFRVMNALIAECNGKKLHFTELFWELNYKRFPEPKFFKFLLDNFNQSKMNKTKLIKKFINSGNVPCLEIVAENGWLKQPRKRDEMIDYAAEKGAVECSAYLLDFKNRTADLAAERAKAEKKAERELNANPNSVAELKKIWSYKKQEDGSLIITSYKGNHTDVTVPEKIGRSAVTAIGENAFKQHTDITLIFKKGSFAEEYCKKYGVRYIYKEDI